MSEYLPVEVILEILKRLPVKSVVKCMSVCKTWNILIKTPSFISTHLQTSLSNPHSHFLLLRRRVLTDNETFSLHFDSGEFDEYQRLHHPVALGRGCMSPYFQVVGSCNGLVCLRCSQSPSMFDFIFWNPSIQKYIILPPKPGITVNNDLIYGFGFDSTTSDYKLLVGLDKNFGTPSEAYLFSLNENSWKSVTTTYSKYFVLTHIPCTFVNGALHWLAVEIIKGVGLRSMILGFDISSEQYFVIRLPDCSIRLRPQNWSMMKCEESSIAVLRSDWKDREIKRLELWVMKTYGEVGSWTKVLHLTTQRGSLPNVLGFRKKGEVLLEVDDGKMVSLDLNCHQMGHLDIDLQAEILSVDSYVESLILLGEGMDAGSVSYANHANDSSGSDSKEESEMA